MPVDEASTPSGRGRAERLGARYGAEIRIHRAESSAPAFPGDASA